VVLNAEQRQRLVAQAFERLVVQVNMGQLDLVGVDRVGIDGEVVVVGGDLHLAVGRVLYRVVAAVVAELQFVSTPAQSQPGKLMAEADSEDRHSTQELANGAHGVIDRLRIAGTVGEEDAVGFQFKNVVGRGLRRNHRHAAAFAHQHPENVPLDAKIVSDDMEFRGLPPLPRRGCVKDGVPGIVALFETDRQKRVSRLVAAIARVEGIDRPGGDEAGQIGAVHLAKASRLLDKEVCVPFSSRDHAAHDAVGAQMADQGAGIDVS